MANTLTDLDNALIKRKSDFELNEKLSFLKSLRLCSVQRRGNELWFMVHVVRIETRKRCSNSYKTWVSTASPVFYINEKKTWNITKGDSETELWRDGDDFDYTRELFVRLKTRCHKYNYGTVLYYLDVYL